VYQNPVPEPSVDLAQLALHAFVAGHDQVTAMENYLSRKIAYSGLLLGSPLGFMVRFYGWVLGLGLRPRVHHLLLSQSVL